MRRLQQLLLLLLLSLALVVLVPIIGSGEPVHRFETPLTAHEFLVELATGRGRPFVVSGAAADWPARGWTLCSLRATHGIKQVRNRRAERGEPLFGANGEFLGRYDPSDAEWEADARAWEADAGAMMDIDGCGGTDQTSRSSSGGGDGGGGGSGGGKGSESVHYISWQVRNASASALLQRDYTLPAFLQPFPASNVHANVGSGASDPNVTETLFIGTTTGESREPHVDYSCESTFSAQLSGVKLWRLRAPSDTKGVLYGDFKTATKTKQNVREGLATSLSPSSSTSVSSSSQSRQQRRPAWRRGVEYTTTLVPGDLIVWHPGWTHATEVLEAPSVSLSRLFSQPTPRSALSNYMAALQAHAEVHDSFTPCFDVWIRRAIEWKDRAAAPAVGSQQQQGDSIESDRRPSDEL